ncbi:putative ubiquinone biosynthesis protein [Penicillium brasilianum]|uniref:Putative ubiquinone biosynthesis protein n=1 Tax=Penicillium brasilianum TaxID=104259 RepID=A0A1S9RJW3_PENBI|nr:putative ubiquinone biosynthesis protein [Penicillium brasilianum]
MRAVLLGRLCLRRGFTHLPRHTFTQSWRAPAKRLPKRAPVVGGLVMAALAPSAFLKLAEDSDGDEMTGEMQMLEASRQEIRKTVSEDARGLARLCQSIRVFWYYYVYDPIATGFRFLHLAVIFIPVVITVPVIWIGGRVEGSNSAQTGTIWWYRFLVKAMERAGPAFIKLGQWAASRTDIFPPEMCNIMSSLHSNAPAHSLEATKRIIRKAFNGMPFEDIFEEFQEEPLGVGAIAQVYKAKLKPSLATSAQELGQEPVTLGEKVRKNMDVLVKSSPHRVPSSYVAIKVLHPKVEKMIHRDLRIMGFFASLINAIPTMHWLSFPDEVQQFGEMMKLQLDMRIEATNLVIFRDKFKTRTTAWFPYPYMEYTTREVLIEEFAQGIPLATFLDIGGGIFQHEIANEGLDAFLHMLLIDNFVHADLHPGNIMVRFYKPSELDLSLRKHSRATEAPTRAEVDVTDAVLARLRPHVGNKAAWESALAKLNDEGYRPQLIFIDTGLVTQLNDLNRRNFLDLFRAIAEFDGYQAGHLMVERCRTPEEVIEPEIFALKMQHLVLSIKSRTFALGNIKIGDVLSEVLTMVRGHHVRFEGDFVNVVISCLLLEGIGRSLNPNLDLFQSALPILRQLGTGQTFLQTVRSGDTSMLRVWVGLEARGLLQASIESVERIFMHTRIQ